MFFRSSAEFFPDSGKIFVYLFCRLRRSQHKTHRLSGIDGIGAVHEKDKLCIEVSAVEDLFTRRNRFYGIPAEKFNCFQIIGTRLDQGVIAGEYHKHDHGKECQGGKMPAFFHQMTDAVKQSGNGKDSNQSEEVILVDLPADHGKRHTIPLRNVRNIMDGNVIAQPDQHAGVVDHGSCGKQHAQNQPEFQPVL